MKPRGLELGLVRLQRLQELLERGRPLPMPGRDQLLHHRLLAGGHVLRVRRHGRRALVPQQPAQGRRLGGVRVLRCHGCRSLCRCRHVLRHRSGPGRHRHLRRRGVGLLHRQRLLGRLGRCQLRLERGDLCLQGLLTRGRHVDRGAHIDLRGRLHRQGRVGCRVQRGGRVQGGGRVLRRRHRRGLARVVVHEELRHGQVLHHFVLLLCRLLRNLGLGLVVSLRVRAVRRGVRGGVDHCVRLKRHWRGRHQRGRSHVARHCCCQLCGRRELRSHGCRRSRRGRRSRSSWRRRGGRLRMRALHRGLRRGVDRRVRLRRHRRGRHRGGARRRCGDLRDSRELRSRGHGLRRCRWLSRSCSLARRRGRLRSSHWRCRLRPVRHRGRRGRLLLRRGLHGHLRDLGLRGRGRCRQCCWLWRLHRRRPSTGMARRAHSRGGGLGRLHGRRCSSTRRGGRRLRLVIAAEEALDIRRQAVHASVIFGPVCSPCC
mmetsp:Transcript_103343/g.267287  ORF Transcript_103343/g.267287 Transcript_103343/m.267287 type:complete len:485 (+) Transcript_103343:1211-2665(+)